jgi:hypothetical protein
MYNITIEREEIAFLREAIISKYCDVIKEAPQQLLQRITGTIKHYEAICEMMREHLQEQKNVIEYTAALSESPFKIALRKWITQREDERARRLSELGLSVSGNILRKLIFYGLQHNDLTFKDAFVMACYIYIGVDRSEWMTKKKTSSSSSGTLPPSAFGQQPKGAAGETVAPFRDNRRCTLVAIDENEQPTAEAVSMEFKGEPLVLNRDNLGPDNNTITSQVQAVLRNNDGKWELENGSRYKTTYIQVIKPTTIQQGDIIVFGNKRFLFMEE